jgi:hypothetical protein
MRGDKAAPHAGFEEHVTRALRAGSDRMDGLQLQLDEHKAMLAENTAATARIEGNTSELVEVFSNLKGAFRVLNWIGRLAKPVGAIIGLGVAMWGAWQAHKTGVPPQ